MVMPARNFSTDGYRYGFNGKEKDDQVKGSGVSYDFGGRVYDSRVGRFLSTDLFIDQYPSLSPYSTCGNNPVRYIDYNGYFKIDPYYLSKYPELGRLVAHYLPLLKDNPDVKQAWMVASGASEADFDNMVTFGSGPWITPDISAKDIGDWTESQAPWVDMFNAGEFDNRYPDNLFIMRGLVEKFESAYSAYLQTGNATDLAVSMFHLSVNIMHESTHWGVFHYIGKSDIMLSTHRENQLGEAGGFFEQRAFGERFSYNIPGELDPFTYEEAQDYLSKNFFQQIGKFLD
jgi:RHS repeat-associated protein